MTIDRATASEAECRTLPYVGLEHIEKGTGNFTADFRCQPETLLATKFRFTPLHVLYGKLRPNLNKAALPNFDGVCTTEIFPLLPKPQTLDRRYLYAVLLSQRFVKWASNSVAGANLPRLDPERLREYEIELPDLTEQQRIAGQLEQVDRLRRTRRYTLELTDTFLPAAFLELFGSAYDSAWDRSTLGELTLDFSYGTSTKCSNNSALHTVLRIPNVIRGAIDTTDLKFGKLNPNERKKLRLEHGDLLFVRTNGNPEYVGRCAVFDLEAELYFASYLIRARTDQKLIAPVFLAAYLRMPDGRRSMQPSIRTTAGQYNVSVEGLRDIQVILPPLDLQQKFATLVDQVERLRAVHREALRQAEHLFTSLHHSAFSG
jgi:type I restriction enzyme S subunit